MENQEKLQELQMLEQNLQNLMLQKQAFQIELSESQSALSELAGAGDETYKIIGQLMLKTEKTKIKDELENKEKMLDLRLKNIEKQETSLTKDLGKIRDELMKSMKH